MRKQEKEKFVKEGIKIGVIAQSIIQDSKIAEQLFGELEKLPAWDYGPDEPCKLGKVLLEDSSTKEAYLKLKEKYIARLRPTPRHGVPAEVV